MVDSDFMHRLSADDCERSRKIRSEILSRLTQHTQSKLADELNISESAVSKMRSEGQLDRTCALLSLLGLRVVPEDALVVEKDWLHAVLILAGKGVEAAREGLK